MKTSIYLLPSLLLILFFSSCRNSTEDYQTSVKVPVKEWSSGDMRDIPGLSMKRGLISNEDGATPGYVLFHTFGTSTVSSQCTSLNSPKGTEYFSQGCKTLEYDL